MEEADDIRSTMFKMREKRLESLKDLKKNLKSAVAPKPARKSDMTSPERIKNANTI